MKKATRFVGLDVHAESIAVAVAESGRDGEVRSLGVIPNRLESVRKLIQKLGGPNGLLVCYEAGPTGFALYWQLTKLGVECAVIAPSLIPTKAGDRVKTDRRDAVKLARCYRAGDLTSVWVPDLAHEALRDLVRAREAAKKDEVRARHRLSKFLLRLGVRPPAETKAWGSIHMQWLRTLKFEHVAQQSTMTDYLGELDHQVERILRLEEALDAAVEQAPAVVREVIESLQALRGVAKLSATAIAIEIGSFTRFDSAKKLMSYVGATPSEHSSGGIRRQGAITKTGNSHVRRVLYEMAWAYRHSPRLGKALKQRQRGLPTEIVEIGWKAQHRLHRRYVALGTRGKPPCKVITAIGRELLGFIWAIATRVEQRHAQQEGDNSRAAA
jgi:transposase